MSGFPCVEVLAASTPTLSPGTRFPLGQVTTLGRAGDVELSLAGLSPRHCRIEHRYERWWVLDLGSSEGVLHNGALVTNVELEHFDLIELGPVVLRFLLREVLDLRDETMEAAIRAAPDDAARYGVYADWLIDHGALLGERMARPRYEGSGKWLGLLAPRWAAGELEIAWFCGVPQRAVVRRLESTSRSLEQVVPQLAREPLFRFLRTLEVDLESIALEAPVDELLPPLLGTVTPHHFPQLSQLTLGPLSHPLPLPRTTTLPISTTTAPSFARVEVLSAPGALTVAPAPGARVTLSTTTPNLVGQTEDCLLRVLAPVGHLASRLAARFSFDQRWRVESLVRTSEGLLRVNGHECLHALLRPGDIIEFTPGLLVRFMPADTVGH